jgi:type I restriction enzyme S subunit
MKNNWLRVQLGELLKKSERWIRIQPNETYKLVTVRLWGKGVVLRGQLTGAEITASEMLQVQPDQFILSRIDARNGAFGLIPESLDGAIVSNDFPVFDIDSTRLLSAFLSWMSKTRDFVDFCRAASEGTTNRVRLKEDRFLTTAIALPPLEEQRRIVAKIQELAAKIGEARGLRQRSVVEIETLISSAGKHFFSAKDVEHLTRLEDLTTRITKGESPEWQGFTYQESGPFFVRSENVLWGKFGKSKQVRIPVEFHEKLSRSQLRAGDVLINLVGASIGRSCVVPDDIGKANVNQAVAVISPDQKQLDSKFLMHFLISEPAQKTIHGGKVETARPNISLTDLRNLMIPVYSLNEQLRIVAYLDGLQGKVDAVKNVQDHTAAELDALLPSILDKAFKGEL